MFSTHLHNYLMFSCYWELYSFFLFPFQILNFISNPDVLEALLRHLARFVRVFKPSVIFTRSPCRCETFNTVDHDQTDNVLFICINRIYRGA